MITATPDKAPYPVDAFFKFSARDQVARSWEHSNDTQELPCNLRVRIGLFFDGTNNNLARDRDGEQVSIDGNSVTGGSDRLGEAQCSHSNVARLFEVYKKNDLVQGDFSYYLPGVGTRFSEVGEFTETSDGKAFSKGGQARIIYSILQVINSIHITIARRPLFTDKKAGAIAQTYDRVVGQRINVSNRVGEAEVGTHARFFEKHIETLRQIILSNQKPNISSVTLDVFGFSRGAAEAVAFCHMFDELLVGGRFASIPAGINFLGIFDTVASVGVSASVAMTTIVPKFLADGHYSWAARILKPLPPSVRCGRHYIAAHEQRMNFPVSTQVGSNFKQVYFPGVHSDVGGGYGPGEGGKGRGHQANLLSQIPLAYMYREACMEGVPFKAYESFPESFKDDFAVSSELAAAWEAYCSELKVHGSDHGGRLRAHMALYYYWRAARLNNLENTEFFKSASKQAQQDMLESNRVLKGDLAMLKQRAAFRFPGDPQLPFSAEELKTISQWHVIRADQPPNAWEKWALSCFERAKVLNNGVMKFFDDYVHDSLAGFYLAGEVTEYDKRVKVDSVMKMKPEKMCRFDKKIYDLTQRVSEVVAKKKRGELLSPDEEALAREAERGTPYPLMTDDDAMDMRNAAIHTQTSSRREGGGYLLKRGYHPQDEEVNEMDQDKEAAA
ncbi:MAG: T6SS phospholipase effector Tle1-like catalytic domain-containing protein [Massilia sp.]